MISNLQKQQDIVRAGYRQSRIQKEEDTERALPLESRQLGRIPLESQHLLQHNATQPHTQVFYIKVNCTKNNKLLSTSKFI